MLLVQKLILLHFIILIIVLMINILTVSNQPLIHSLTHIFTHSFTHYSYTELVWKVARYTSAGPTYFSECDDFVDGGVLANNPCTTSWVEICDYHDRMVSGRVPSRQELQS